MPLLTLPVLTDASGNASVTFNAEGYLEEIAYVPDATVPLATGADVQVVGMLSGRILYNQADIGTTQFSRPPRRLIANAADGVVGTEYGYIYMAGGEQLKLTVAQGGNARRGTFAVFYSK